MMRVAACAGALVMAAVACASTRSGVSADSAGAARSSAAANAPGRVVVDPEARFWYAPSMPLGHPAADSLVNQNGSLSERRATLEG